MIIKHSKGDKPTGTYNTYGQEDSRTDNFNKAGGQSPPTNY